MNVSLDSNKGIGKLSGKRLKCEEICLNDPINNSKQSFKLFKEEDFPDPLRQFMKVDSVMEERDCDDDYLTDNEQIATAKKLINNDIKVVFKEYLKQKKESENGIKEK